MARADEFFVEGGDDGLDGEAVARRRFDQRHVAQADERHVERARDRRGGERERVDVFAHFFQALFVGDAEALLFVDDRAGRGRGTLRLWRAGDACR